MMRWSLFFAAVSLLVVGLLNVRQVPDWGPWKLAVLAGEFGHWLAVGALAVAGVAGMAAWSAREAGSVGGSEAVERGSGGRAAVVVSGCAAVLALGAAGFLLVPAWQAGGVARELPGKLRKAFGEVAMGREVFAVGEFWGGKAEAVKVETMEVSAGLPVDFYRAVDKRPGAAAVTGGAPCVIVVHGGGWDSGDRTQLPELNHWLARRGFAVAAVSYRLAPRHRWPAQRDDVLAALAWVKARAGELGVDARRIVLLGRSAGGQIAQAVGYTARDPAIRGVVALYAPSDLYFGYVNTHENDMLRSPALMRQFLGGSPEQVRAQYESASPLNFVTGESPPTLLLHGTQDALAWHRHSERLEARLSEAGVPNVYVRLPWATHAFDFNLRGPGGQLTTFAVEWFLRAVTREGERGSDGGDGHKKAQRSEGE